MDAIRNTTTSLALLVAALSLPLLTSCGDTRDAQPTAPEAATLAALKLNAIENCGEFQTFVTHSLIEQYRPRSGSLRSPPVDTTEGGAVPVSTPAAPASGGAGGSSPSDAAPTHVTGTNTQEIGVDEPDIVKTDADGNLYIARGGSLRIVSGHPPQALKELATLDAGGRIYDLFLDETQHRAVLFAAKYNDLIPAFPLAGGHGATIPGSYAPPQFVVSFVDVATPANPKLTARWTLDGYPLDARRVGARIHFVLADSIELPAALANDTTFWNLYSEYYSATTVDAANAIEQKIVDAIRAAVAALDAASFLPAIAVAKDGGSSASPIMGCSDVVAPKVLIHPSLLTVASFDTDGSNLSASAITAYGATVYASATHLYVTQYSGGWFNSDEYRPQTAIHQFRVDGAAPKYLATGLVDGWVRDAFSLSEYNDNLRVVTNTTTWSKGITARTNDLFILQNNGNGELALRSSVRKFGNDESLFSARFLGPRGFVVTFRQVDPLFAFDLSDADSPKLLGELTIPGFSTYMHPLGENHLLTIGRDGARAMQLQIFDVTDLTKPSLLHRYTPLLPGSSYSYSEAEYDHHAFTFDASNHTLAIPLSYWGNNGGDDYFNGIAAFNIDVTTGIKEIVRIDHADLANQANCGAEAISTCNYWYAASPRRSVIMTADSGLTLYSISDAGVKATGLAPPNDTLGSVVFPLEPQPPIVIGPPDIIVQ